MSFPHQYPIPDFVTTVLDDLRQFATSLNNWVDRIEEAARLHYTNNSDIEHGQLQKSNLIFLSKLKRGMAKVFEDNSTKIMAEILHEEEFNASTADTSFGRNNSPDAFTKIFVDAFNGFVRENLGLLCRQVVVEPKLLSVTSKKENEIQIEMKIQRPISTSLMRELKVRVVCDEMPLFGPVSLGQLFKLGIVNDSQKNLSISIDLPILSRLTSREFVCSVEAFVTTNPIEGSPMNLFSSSEGNTQSITGEPAAASNWTEVGTGNLPSTRNGNNGNNYSGLDESDIKSMTLDKSRKQLGQISFQDDKIGKSSSKIGPEVTINLCPLSSLTGVEANSNPPKKSAQKNDRREIIRAPAMQTVQEVSRESSRSSTFSSKTSQESLSRSKTASEKVPMEKPDEINSSVMHHHDLDVSCYDFNDGTLSSTFATSDEIKAARQYRSFLDKTLKPSENAAENAKAYQNVKNTASGLPAVSGIIANLGSPKSSPFRGALQKDILLPLDQPSPVPNQIKKPSTVIAEEDPTFTPNVASTSSTLGEALKRLNISKFPPLTNDDNEDLDDKFKKAVSSEDVTIPIPHDLSKDFPGQK